ncbi:alpha/beta fold hydrolase [Allonocardiopsis opalescens]|uniref:Pimeloyl-ACP methyl ester carboxylesterase n=1 Tax=Allonocardiopsis opalescens TaxID=1144618 RepID=A0A2T0Q4X7_9ACTN|nr:alpha/beta fold hydrolase [Allonocardiopsis opalescens]PRX98867.1 pimeloyl-ACP methyl ester carboxylesterase [Allonocardiopsis opalescens]
MTQFLDVPGGRLAYELTGPDKGPLVVCAPGMGDVRASYRFLVPALLEAGHRVATVDLRGHGESSTGWADYSPEAAGADLLALVRHLGGPAALIGHSFSPAPVVWAAAEAPDAVSSITLIAPWVSEPKTSPLLRLAAGVIMRSPTLFAKVFYPSLYKGGRPDDLAVYTDAMRAKLAEPGRLTALRGVGNASKANANARMAEVRCPALVVMGTADPDFPDPAAEARLAQRRLAPSAASVTVHLVEGAGHYPHIERPGEVAPAVVSFLAGAVRA